MSSKQEDTVQSIIQANQSQGTEIASSNISDSFQSEKEKIDIAFRKEENYSTKRATLHDPV